MDEATYNITNADGTVVGQIGTTNSDDIVIEHPGSGETVTLGPDGLTTSAVSTGDLFVNNAGTSQIWGNERTLSDDETRDLSITQGGILVFRGGDPSANDTFAAVATYYNATSDILSTSDVAITDSVDLRNSGAGTDDKWIISRYYNGIQVKNRTGSESVYSISFLTFNDS